MHLAILLIASGSTALHVADVLRAELDCAVDVAPNRRSGLAQLRRREYELVLLEESLVADPDATDALYQNAAAASVLEIGFGVVTAPRVLRQVKSMLARRAHDRAQARAAVASALQQELNASLSGLLLESQLALKEATPQQAGKLRHVVALAGELRDRLRAS